jgi:hypothetical protein
MYDNRRSHLGFQISNNSIPSAAVLPLHRSGVIKYLLSHLYSPLFAFNGKGTPEIAGVE